MKQKDVKYPPNHTGKRKSMIVRLLLASNYQNKSEDMAEANSRIDEQIGAVLSEIATAAGPEQIAKALAINSPTVEPNSQASPN